MNTVSIMCSTPSNYPNCKEDFNRAKGSSGNRAMTDLTRLTARGDPGAPPSTRKEGKACAEWRRGASSKLAILTAAALMLSAYPASAQVFPWLPQASCTDPNCAPVRPVENTNVVGGYTTTPQYANSPELKKFIDPLPIIPFAAPDTTTFPGSDYYELSVKEYVHKMHSDLPASHIRGYLQTNGVMARGEGHIHLKPWRSQGKPVGNRNQPNWAGPIIIAKRDVPVRIRLKNELRTRFFLPVDETNPGAGYGPPIHPDGSFCTLTEAQNPSSDCSNNLHLSDTAQKFSKNRALLHLHGGYTPWISDGTPHQWVRPAGDPSIYKNGVSYRNVPDMTTGVTPGDGVATYWYSNQQSGRMMWYHDHSFGITRLTLYAGEEAGYILTDPDEEALTKVNGSGALAGVGEGVPLVIQDRTWVRTGASDPFATQITDPMWKNFGSNPGNYVPGDLWFPRVYQPNQLPADGSINPMGRWDYGPWFQPPALIFNSTLPTVSITPESFMDSMIVNGMAFPYLEVGKKPIRLRILNAANDRMLNLQLYYATTGAGTVGAAKSCVPTSKNKCTVPAEQKCDGPDHKPSECTEVKMVPANGASYKNVPLKYTPTGSGPVWVPFDNRVGGVPNPEWQGPPLIQIGGNGGLLPAPVVQYSRPVDYEYDRKSITVLNIRNSPVSAPPGCTSCYFPFPGYSLFLPSADRADVIIDFSEVPDGSTLILYNDAPAPNPAFDTRVDLYTGKPDNRATGGYGAVKKGFGPNTRTIMQFRVNAKKLGSSPKDSPYLQPGWLIVKPDQSIGSGVLARAVSNAYRKSHTPTAADPNETTQYVHPCDPDLPNTCADTRLCTFGNAVGGAAGNCLTGKTEFPICQGWNPDRALQLAQGTARDANGNLINPATVPPALLSTVVGGAVTVQRSENYGLAHFRDNTPDGCGYPVYNKSVAEDFDPIYGRLDAKLGTEAPALNAQGQQTFGFYYADPASEYANIGETQVWNLVHNGVDTHSLHIHLVSAQIINRVDWAGVIKPADPNELGWRETFVANPLENIIFVVRPTLPTVPTAWNWYTPGAQYPWANAPTSIRPREVTTALGVGDPALTMNQNALFPFTYTLMHDPNTNQDVNVVNALENYQWEYVWHCHILGHEENDMMRPWIVVTQPNWPLPLVPIP
jgi:FtsP/CotA-like multicopper oxidase with cupredoxin domain